MSLIPDSWGSTLREFNDCHEPAGSPEGGRFCRKGTRAAEEPGFPGYEHVYPGGKRVGAEGDPTYAVPALRAFAPHIETVWEHSTSTRPDDMTFAGMRVVSTGFREAMVFIDANGNRIMPRPDVAGRKWMVAEMRAPRNAFVRGSKVILGRRNAVPMTGKELGQVLGRVKTMIHSHPDVMSFSPHDIMMALDVKIPETIVVTAEKTYVMGISWDDLLSVQDESDPIPGSRDDLLSVLKDESDKIRDWQDGPLLQLAIKTARDRGWTTAHPNNFESHRDFFDHLSSRRIFREMEEYETALTVKPTAEYLDAMWRRLAADPKNGLTYRVFETRRKR